MTNPTPTRPEPTTPTREELLNAAADLLQAKSDEHGRIALDNNAALPSETHRIIQHTYAYAAALVRHMDSEPAAPTRYELRCVECKREYARGAAEWDRFFQRWLCHVCKVACAKMDEPELAADLASIKLGAYYEEIEAGLRRTIQKYEAVASPTFASEVMAEIFGDRDHEPAAPTLVAAARAHVEAYNARLDDDGNFLGMDLVLAQTFTSLDMALNPEPAAPTRGSSK